MAKKDNGKFVEDFSKFYERFFSNIADSVEDLANVQKKYPNEYKKIQEFSRDPTALESLLKELPPEKQATILRLLLRAGDFGRRFATLIESSEKEKRKLSKELKEFAQELKKEIRRGS